MITLHHLNQSRSKRVIWLLEELGLAYTIVNHSRDAVTQLAPASLKAIHPLGKAPIMVDEGSFLTDANTIVLCESGAIMEYLLAKADASANTVECRPNMSHPSYYKYLEWLHFAEGSLGLAVITKLFMTMEQRSGDQPMDGYIAKELALDLGYINHTLATQPYFAGETFSAADVMMTIMLEIAQNVGLLTDYPEIVRYLENITLRDGYKVAAAKG
jgi:glutathione S-transferase